LTTYISLLKGINVGGHNKIKMDALRQMYLKLGYTDVQSYIQSGNLIFRTNETDKQLIEQRITNGIAHDFGLNIAVLVLTETELEATLKNNPFSADSSDNPNYMYLTFLSEVPDQTLMDTIVPESYLPDKFCHWNKVIYVYCPGGYGNTKLTNAFFEKKLKLTATCRNLKTSEKLLAMAEKL
jgi:uncharacterized protein (DUF1697 family)